MKGAGLMLKGCGRAARAAAVAAMAVTATVAAVATIAAVAAAVTLAIASPARAAEPQAAPPDLQAVRQVLCLGDSLTQGLYAVTAADSWRARVDAWLGSAVGVGSGSVFLGQTGGKTADFLPQLAAISAVDADLCFIELGTNDASGFPTMVPVPPATFKANLCAISAAVRVNRPNCILVYLTTWRENAALTYDAVIRAVAARDGGIVVDLAPIGSDPANYLPAGVLTFNGASDGWHPNNAGHAAIAAAVESALQWKIALSLARGAAFTRSRSVPVEVSALDRLGAITQLSCSRDGRSWSAWSTWSASLTVTLPAGNGLKTLYVRLRDSQGVTSPSASAAIVLDTSPPTTFAKPAHGREGRPIRLEGLVRDNLSREAQAVTLTVYNSRRAIVRTFRLGPRKVATWYAVTWTPRAAGVYHYAVTATDLAGNSQAHAGSAKITVRQDRAKAATGNGSLPQSADATTQANLRRVPAT
jgi:lysophospholipase L1-like esterase